jgi:hypothetical protein
MNFTKLILFRLLAAAFVGGQAVLPLDRPVAWAKPGPTTPSSGTQPKEELPTIILLNQSAVLIASKKNMEEHREHQARLIDMMNKGVTVLICPDCMTRCGIKAADLVVGVQIGKPGQTHESCNG